MNPPILFASGTIILLPTIFQRWTESIVSHRNINFPSTLSAVLTSIRIFKYFFPNSPSFRVWLYRFHLPLKRQSCCQRISKVSKNQSLRIKISIFNLQIFLFRIVHQWKLGPTFPVYLCNDNPGADMIFFFSESAEINQISVNMSAVPDNISVASNPIGIFKDVSNISGFHSDIHLIFLVAIPFPESKTKTKHKVEEWNQSNEYQIVIIIIPVDTRSRSFLPFFLYIKVSPSRFFFYYPE